jgi:hypothetical protein
MRHTQDTLTFLSAVRQTGRKRKKTDLTAAEHEILPNENSQL